MWKGLSDLISSHWENHHFAGVAVGCGWQAVVAYINVGCYYGVGVPLGCVLGFKFDLGVKVRYFCIGRCLFNDYCVKERWRFYAGFTIWWEKEDVSNSNFDLMICTIGNMVRYDWGNNDADPYSIMDHISHWLE